MAQMARKFVACNSAIIIIPGNPRGQGPLHFFVSQIHFVSTIRLPPTPPHRPHIPIFTHIMSASTSKDEALPWIQKPVLSDPITPSRRSTTPATRFNRNKSSPPRRATTPPRRAIPPPRPHVCLIPSRNRLRLLFPHQHQHPHPMPITTLSHPLPNHPPSS